jgi:adenylylsulfate kinase
VAISIERPNVPATGVAIWLTGMSGAGKSTIASALQERLANGSRRIEILDGDEIREELSKDLSFSREDRERNVSRIAYVASLLVKHGVTVVTAAISPYAQGRARARARIGRFVEVYVRCPLDELTRRDVKGLYARALRGEIAHFTGVSDPYEAPENPDVIVDSSLETVEQSVQKILDALERYDACGRPTG